MLHSAKERITCLESWSHSKNEVLTELRFKQVESTAATRHAKDKLRKQEDGLASTQLEMISQVVKASVTSSEAGFRECRALVKQLFPKVDASLLRTPSEQESTKVEGAQEQQHRGS